MKQKKKLENADETLKFVEEIIDCNKNAKKNFLLA